MFISYGEMVYFFYKHELHHMPYIHGYFPKMSEINLILVNRSKVYLQQVGHIF